MEATFSRASVAYKQDGTEVAAGAPRYESLANIGEPLLVITFDDTHSSDYTIAFPEMTARGLYGTPYITTNYVGGSWALSWPQIAEMRAAGWATECHTHTHPDLTTLTDAEIRTELETVNAAFITNGLAAPRHHAYPGGTFDTRVKGIVAEYRDTADRVGGLFNAYATMDYFEIRRSGAHMTTEAHLEWVKSFLRRHMRNNDIAVLVLHRIVEADPVPAQYDCLASLFRQLLDFVVECGIKVVTTPQMYAIVRAFRGEG